MKTKYKLTIAAVILIAFMTSMALANPGENRACNGCHTYPPTSINISTDITTITVSPGQTFNVNISWNGGNPTGATEINWPTDFTILVPSIARDNTLFNPALRIPASVSNTPGGTTNSTLTAPQAPGTYTVRVYASRKAPMETDFKDITVTVQASYNVSLGVDAKDKTTSPGLNATYRLTINNTGKAVDNYSLSISNPDGASVGLGSTQIQNLAAGANATVLLNVTNATAGTFRVNVTAISVGEPNRTASVNTTTLVSEPSMFGVSLIVDVPARTTSPGVNATYKLTINNTGNAMDNYTLALSNPDGASVGLGSTQIQNLAAGANATVLLNVTNATAGTFRVNVTAISVGEPNRTASVNTTTSVSAQPQSGAPNMTSFSPRSDIVQNEAGDHRTFSIAVNQTVNVTWFIYDLNMVGTVVLTQNNVTESSYTNTSAGEGIWTVKATATNSRGTVWNSWMWIVTPITPGEIIADVRIKPETLNLASKGKFTAFISLPEGNDVKNIDINTVMCEGAPAVKGKIIKKGTVLKVKFNRQDLVNVPTGNAVELTVTGELADGMEFQGSDTIKVINKSNGREEELEDDKDEIEEGEDDNENENDEEDEEDEEDEDDIKSKNILDSEKEHKNVKTVNNNRDQKDDKVKKAEKVKQSEKMKKEKKVKGKNKGKD